MKEHLEKFSSIVSHDLRNPLNVPQGRLQLAAEECDSEHLADVANAHDRMEDLIKDLLAVARVGNHISKIEPVPLGSFSEIC